jgi:hypothetical protein
VDVIQLVVRRPFLAVELGREVGPEGVDRVGIAHQVAELGDEAPRPMVAVEPEEGDIAIAEGRWVLCSHVGSMEDKGCLDFEPS